MGLPLLKDSSGEPSATFTAGVIGFAVALIKMTIAGMTLFGHVMPEFGGGDFAAVAGSLGAVYTFRRSGKNGSSDSKE